MTTNPRTAVVLASRIFPDFRPEKGTDNYDSVYMGNLIAMLKDNLYYTKGMFQSLESVLYPVPKGKTLSPIHRALGAFSENEGIDFSAITKPDWNKMGGEFTDVILLWNGVDNLPYKAAKLATMRRDINLHVLTVRD